MFIDGTRHKPWGKLKPLKQRQTAAGSLLQVEEGDPVPHGADEAAAIAGEAEVATAVDGAQQAGELRGGGKKKKPERAAVRAEARSGPSEGGKEGEGRPLRALTR